MKDWLLVPIQTARIEGMREYAHVVTVVATPEPAGAIDYTLVCSCGYLSLPCTSRTSAEHERCAVYEAEKDRARHAQSPHAERVMRALVERDREARDE